MSRGLDIQLKILQILLSLITNFSAEYPQTYALSLCARSFLPFLIKLQEFRMAVVSSTAAATLYQLVLFIVDKVIEEDRRMLLANELESINSSARDDTSAPAPPRTTTSLSLRTSVCW